MELFFENYYLYFGYFFVYAFIGWISEVLYTLVTTRKLTNRGFLYGPLCPIYGVAAVILLFFIYKYRGNPILVFFIGFVLCSLIELITGVLLEKIFHLQWWNYEGLFLNYRGYVCLRFSLYWGILSLVLVEFIHPFVTDVFSMFNTNVLRMIVEILIIAFVIDLTITVSRLIQFKKVFSKLLAARIEVAELAKTYFENKLEELKDRHLIESTKHDEITAQFQIFSKSFKRSFPLLKSNRHSDLNEIINNSINKKIKEDKEVS